MTTSAGVTRAAYWTAHAVPLVILPSGLWRLAVAFNAPIVGDPDMRAPERAYLVALTVLSEALGLLTLGLIQPWGERVFGRRIPIRAAVIPATVGAALVTLLCLYAALTPVLPHAHVRPQIGDATSGAPQTGAALWITVACYLPLAAWGPLLFSATVSYRRRRLDTARSG